MGRLCLKRAAGRVKQLRDASCQLRVAVSGQERIEMREVVQSSENRIHRFGRVRRVGQQQGQ